MTTENQDAHAQDAGDTNSATDKVEVTPDKTTPVDSTKVVPEKDLLAVKSSAKKEIKDVNNAADAKVAEIAQQLDTTKQSLLQAEAKVQTLEEKATQSAPAEELTQAKQELEVAKGAAETSANDALEVRRKLITTEHGIPAAALENKTLEQLGYFEEALKAVKQQTGAGVGNYATGGGGAIAAPVSDIDRAHAIIKHANEQRGGPVKVSSS